MTDALKFLRCPDTGSRLFIASGAIIGELRDAVSRGEIVNRLGKTISTNIDNALVNESSTLLYPVVNEIPQMVLDEAIPLDQLQRKGI